MLPAASRYAAALAIATVALLASCSSGGAASGGGREAGSASSHTTTGESKAGSGRTGGSSSGSGQLALAPLTAIKMASTQVQAANSLAGTISIQVGGSDPESLTGSMQIQMKPSLLLAENLNVDSGGQTTAVNEVVSGTALYIETPGLTVQPGKPWVEVPFSELTGKLSLAFSQLVQDTESGNPLTQAQAFTESKNAREVGTQTIDGVSTTHYEGTVPAAAAAATLPAGLRQAGSAGATGDITWNVWLDSQHNLRQLTENETVGGAPVTTTAIVTSINPTATAELPPASQVGVVPASAVSGSI